MLDEVGTKDVGVRPWAVELCQDMVFLEAQCRTLGLPAVERALRQAAVEHGGVVAAIHRALRAEAHGLRRDVSTLPALIERRLRSAGWEPAQIQRDLRFPTGNPALRLRHPVQLSEAELTLEGHQDGVWACAVTPNGRRLVSASRDRTLRVWDLHSGEALAVLRGHDAAIRDCAVMPDGQRVVSASADSTLRIWDLETGRTLVTLAGHERRVLACTVTPDGRRIVSASSDGTLRLWDSKTGEALAILAGHEDEVRDCAATPDGRRVISVSKDGLMKIWDLTTGETLATLQGSGAWLDSCAVSPDGRLVIVAANKRGVAPGLIVAWDLTTRQPIATFRGHTRNVTACVVMPDGRRIISASSDRTVRVWEIATGREIEVLDIRCLGHHDIVLACAVTPDDGHIVTASWDRTLRVSSLTAARAPAAAAQASASSWTLRHCAPTLDGRRAVTLGPGQAFQVWSLDTGKVLSRFTAQLPKGFSRQRMAIGDRRLVVQGDQVLKALDLETGREIATLVGDDIRIGGSSMVHGDRWVVFYERKERGLHVWDLETDRGVTLAEAGRLGCVTTPGQRCAFIDGSIVVWDESGRVVSVFETMIDVQAITWAATSDGRHLVTAPLMPLKTIPICVWDLTTGKAIVIIAPDAPPSPPFPPVLSCAVTPDGRRIYTSILGGCVDAWDLKTGTRVAMLHIDGGVQCLAATNEVLCAGDLLGNLWIFEVPPPSSGPIPPML